MAIQLTEPAIARAARAAEAGQRAELVDARTPGLRLRFGRRGATWSLACRDPEGRMRRFLLGAWPAVGISAARDAARQQREAIRRGADPVADARRTRAASRDAAQGIGTLAALLALYEAKRPTEDKARMKSWPEARRRIEHVFAALLARPLARLDAADLQAAADAHPSAQSAGAACRYLRPVLRWAAHPKRGLADPTLAGIIPPASPGRRERVLKEAELRAVLRVTAGRSDPFAHAVRLLLLTVARRSEALLARWEDVDLAASRWTLPTTKSGNEHVIPLSRQARDLLASLAPSEPDGLIFATAAGTPLANIDRELKRLRCETETAGWALHDLRRTAATLMGELGADPHVVEAALNHKDVAGSRLAGLYNRARYRPQVARALQLLADRLDAIEAGGGAEIVPLRA